MRYMDNVKSGELHVPLLQELKLLTKNTIKLMGTYCNGMLTFAFFVKPHSQVQGFPREFSSHKLMHFTNIVSSKLLNQSQHSGAANNKFCKALWLE